MLALHYIRLYHLTISDYIRLYQTISDYIRLYQTIPYISYGLTWFTQFKDSHGQQPRSATAGWQPRCSMVPISGQAASPSPGSVGWEVENHMNNGDVAMKNGFSMFCLP